MASTPDHKRTRERLRQVAWSAVVALVLWFFSILEPIDQLIWSAQARLADFEPSGEIVFVGSKQDLADPAFPHRREELAQVIRNLKEAGAEAVYIDVAFEQASRPSSDAALNEALRTFGPRAFLIRNLVTELGDQIAFERSAEAVGRGVQELGGQREFGFLGFVWEMPYVVGHEGLNLTSAAASIAGRSTSQEGNFPVNYGFELGSIPSARFNQLAADQISGELAARLRGKQVVIGHIGLGTSFDIPGHMNVPGAMIHIYAAETLKAGYIRTIAGIAVSFGALASLALAAFLQRPFVCRIIYGSLVASIPAFVIFTALSGIRVSVGGAISLLVPYALFRLRSKWKSDLRLFDETTGLPTFAALEGDKPTATESPTIIVAKIHRFEEVQQTLPPELHSEYILRITDRLAAVSPESKIYLGPGHLIAWCVAETEPGTVKEHLEGLRALFALPLHVGGEQVDAGITFGVDISPSHDVTRRLANAVSAAERTTETYEPILIAEARSEEELIWNISLQARIDAALAQNEIFLMYQPKVLIETGEMIGMEALVRWRDPVKGLIPPDQFISQCESTGRMGHLTRHVLREACKGGNVLARQGIAMTIAVNISATLLHDPAIVAMVRQVLEETGYDPKRLTLEITETYRISEIEVAAGILKELTALGPTISMDDFGVGAASLEALLRLPFAELKIDRIFIDRITEDPKALGIVRSILLLGTQLRIVVVAEGVEDQATLDLLREAGCRVAQGFGICRPGSLDQAVQFRHTSRETAIQRRG